MKRKYCTLYLSEDEYSLTLDALIRLKNKLIRQGRYADIVVEVIFASGGCKTQTGPCLITT